MFVSLVGATRYYWANHASRTQAGGHPPTCLTPSLMFRVLSVSALSVTHSEDTDRSDRSLVRTLRHSRATSGESLSAAHASDRPRAPDIAQQVGSHPGQSRNKPAVGVEVSMGHHRKVRTTWQRAEQRRIGAASRARRNKTTHSLGESCNACGGYGLLPKGRGPCQCECHTA